MYIDNYRLKNQISNWLVFMFWIISLMICWRINQTNRSGLSITKWQLFSGFLPPLNNEDWSNYFNLYKEIPSLKYKTMTCLFLNLR